MTIGLAEAFCLNGALWWGTATTPWLPRLKEICGAQRITHAAATDEVDVYLPHSVETRPLGGGNMSRQPYWRRRVAAQERA